MLSSPPLPKLSTFLRPPAADSPTSELFVAAPVAPMVSTPGRQLTSTTSTSVSSSNGTSSPATGEPVRVRERTSRYLSEADRRDIVSRINAGEKQVTLAREYCVSRAAICNLYKNRKQVLTRSRDAAAKQPKRQARSDDSDTSSMASYSPVSASRFAQQCQQQQAKQEFQSIDRRDFRVRHAALSQAQPGKSPPRPSFKDVASQVPVATSKTGVQAFLSSNWSRYVPFRVHEASAGSLAIRRLVGDLRDARCVGAEFHKYAARLMRLLVEEALTQLPSHEVEVQTSCGDICRVARPMDERDVIGITMEKSGSTPSLFEAFSEIQSNAPTGFVSIERPVSTEDATNKSATSQLPRMNSRSVTMLFDVECPTGAEACAALHHLVAECAVAPGSIYFVTVISSRPGLQFIHNSYPGELVCFLCAMSWRVLC